MAIICLVALFVGAFIIDLFIKLAKFTPKPRNKKKDITMKQVTDFEELLEDDEIEGE